MSSHHPQAHLTHVSALSSPGTSLYPASYADATSGRSWHNGPGFLSPFGHRHSLVGSSFARCRSWAFLTVGLPARRPDLNGVVMLRMSKLRPGRTPPLPRGRWCAPGRRLLSGRHLPLYCGQSLRPRWNLPSAGGTFTRHQRRFTPFAPHPGGLTAAGAGRNLPTGLLLACNPRMERGSLGLFPDASHPAVTRDARRGGDRPPRTGPSTTPSTSAEPPTVPPT